MMHLASRSYYVAAYYLSWATFALGGLLLNLACVPLLPFRASPALQRLCRRTIAALFRAWAWWLGATGVLRITWRNVPSPLPRGAVYVANHPTLIDAPVLLCRLPDAICIFKPALMRNPVIGFAARTANYAAGDGVEALCDAAAGVAAGQSLLIFPEGTRTTPGAQLGALKHGFAVIAQRAQAPVQAVSIRASAGLVRRGLPWWRAPAILPGTFDVSFGRLWPADPERSAVALAGEVEAHLRAQLPAAP